MTWSGSATRSVWGLALLATTLVACSDGGATGPAPGVTTVGFKPKA